MGGSVSSVNVPQVELPQEYTAIITGGHQGLGYELSKHLALLGARVIIASDSPSKAEAAMLRIRADAIDIRSKLIELKISENMDDSRNYEIGSQDSDEVAVPDLKVEFMKLDFRSLDNVNHFVETFKAKGYPLHLLVCNHAVVEVPKAYTEDGYETHFQVNYLGHFLLSLQLIPLMKEVNSEARIVMVTAREHTSGDFNPRTAQGRGQYNKSTYYANSKFCQLLHMNCLERRLVNSNVATFAIHGGAIDTILKKNVDNPAAWGTTYNVARSLGKIANNMSKNVTSTLNVCLSPQLSDLRGSYFVDGVPVTPALKTRDVKLQEILWRYSVDCLENQIRDDMMEGMTISADDISQEVAAK